MRARNIEPNRFPIDRGTRVTRHGKRVVVDRIDGYQVYARFDDVTN